MMLGKSSVCRKGVMMSINGMPAPDLSPETLRHLLTDTLSRQVLLTTKIRQYKKRYQTSLELLEARLDRGEGTEHPDWEDSIEWRTAAESLTRTQQMQSLLEWLLTLKRPSSVS
jgi:hypothetical protein